MCEFYNLKTNVSNEYNLFITTKFPEKIKRCLNVYNFIVENNLNKTYVGLFKLYGIFLTLPITFASFERKFIKLDLVKDAKRSTMSQDRLEGLMLLACEQDVTSNVDFSDVIQRFASITSRRMLL